MSRRKISGPSAGQCYRGQLRKAMSMFFPHQGLPLLCDDRRVRWSDRMLVTAAVLIAWSGAATLLDRFNQARAALTDMYPTRRRPGGSTEGFCKALDQRGQTLLRMLCDHWRACTAKMAGAHWKIAGWLVFSVDGSKFDCPRTAANEDGFGVSGKNKSGPQQLLTCLFHVASGVLWGWTRDGVQGCGEPTQLRQMLHLLPPDALLLADAGYTGYELLKTLIERGNHFLIRVGANVTLIRHLGYARIEGKQTVYLWPLDKQGRNKRSMPKTLGRVHPPLVLRLIELKDTNGKPVVLLTSVTHSRKLTNRAAAKMYRLRWGVEVMWRGLKQIMGHDKMLGKTPGRAAAELDWAMAGLWMLQLLAARAMNHSGQSPTDHSPARSLRIVRGALLGRSARGQNLLAQLQRATKDKYHRTSSKTARYRHEKRPQRPPGRPQARMASRIEKQVIQRILEQPPPNSLAA